MGGDVALNKGSKGAGTDNARERRVIVLERFDEASEVARAVDVPSAFDRPFRRFAEAALAPL